MKDINYCLEKEVWKDIEEYDGVYQVSNLGRVKSIDRYITNVNGKVIFTKGKMLNGFIKPKKYCCIDLYKKGISKKFVTIQSHLRFAEICR